MSDSEEESTCSVSNEFNERRATVGYLPDYEHPAVEALVDLNFKILPENFFVISYGARRTGKTHSVSCLLYDIKDRFDFAYLFSSTANLHKGQKGELDFDMIREEAKFQGFDEEALSRIIERQKTVMMFNNKCKYERDKKPNKTLIIFDDFVHEKQIRYSKLFTSLPVLGRHYELSVICLSQGYSAVGSSGLNPATRQNSDLVMTFLPRNSADVERIAQWYLAKEKADAMWFVQSTCKQEHRLLAVDLQHPHLTEYEDCCYKYVAPKQVPKYELGKVQWKIWREEQKRAKKAKLSSQVEHENIFYSGTSTLEKFSKLNEATGRPENQGKLSLFDAARLLGS